MRITLSGDLGSGKSTIGKRLSVLLNVPYISTGQLFREIGQISNMDALRTNLAAEDNADIDNAVDGRIKELDATAPDFILDSRMAWHFVHGAMNVFLSVRPETAATRIVADTSRATEKYDSVGAAIDALRRRRDSEIKRYRTLYGVNIDDMANYDLAIITDDGSLDAITAVIAQSAARAKSHKHWIPKERLVPMTDLPANAKPAPPPAAGDPSSLALCVENNFGFYFGDAAPLLGAFASASGVIPYTPDTSDAGSLTARAEQTLRPDDLRRWQDAAGVQLAFARRSLAEAAGTKA